MNVRDKRSIGAQIRSGFHLAGWVLFTLAFVFLLLGCTASLMGKGGHTQPIHRVFAMCGLLAASIVMFITVRRWVGWFIGFLAYFTLKAGISLVLGFTSSVPSITRPRTIFLSLFLLLVLTTALCARYVNRTPNTAETLGLIGLVIALCFSINGNSNIPIFSGVGLLGVIQFAQGVRGKFQAT